MPTLWSSPAVTAWQEALDRYRDVVASRGVARLPELDAWYHDDLPPAIRARTPRHLTHAELVRLTEWKMARGVWRAPNLVLVRGNDPELVRDTSRAAFEAMPDPRKPIATLTTLAGVGPATASAAAAAVAPENYPFFDELVAGQVEGLGKVAWTLGYYLRYAAALRDRASALPPGWTPAMVERALWANVAGPAGGA